MTRRSRPEQRIQQAIFEHFAARGAAGVFAFHPANGGWRSRVEAAILKSCGVKPGLPDVFAVKQGRTYALELKAPGGRLSDDQARTIAELEAAGAICAVSTGLDAAIVQLEAWGLLRGRVQVARAGAPPITNATRPTPRPPTAEVSA